MSRLHPYTLICIIKQSPVMLENCKTSCTNCLTLSANVSFLIIMINVCNLHVLQGILGFTKPACQRKFLQDQAFQCCICVYRKNSIRQAWRERFRFVTMATEGDLSGKQATLCNICRSISNRHLKTLKSVCSCLHLSHYY